MKIKNKLYTVLVCFLILILLAGLGAFKPKIANGKSDSSGTESEAKSTTDTGTKKIKKIGGISSRMPENSALVFFGSTFGLKLTNYKGYKNFDEALLALRSGETDAVWACDVSADYLLKINEDLAKVDAEISADIQKTEDARFSFGMALKKDSGETLRDKINGAISDMKTDGTLAGLISKYIENAEYYETEQGKEARFYPDKMRNNGKDGTITIGITGAVPPIELLDEDMEPYGFCVAFMDEIGARIGKKVKFLYIENETAFTSLMSGRVDLIFSYGTGRITTEYKQNFIMTDGYYEMGRYDLISLRSTQ
ncbi:MAG: transporter substrate-binding domain-containing protein [Lachnospiraceae bacterium]|nr:transporter substrate-binding domain-containing protein [Lachnospiraceae bacterium]